MQSVHGAETIVVDVPSGGAFVPKEELWKVDQYRLKRIVPIIRSSDNLYWVACLGTGFDGPYYVFENINNITEAELDGTSDSLLHNTKISTGKGVLYGDLSPELFFIAQTGVVADPEKIENGDFEWVDVTETSTSTTYVGEETFYCPSMAVVYYWTGDDLANQTSTLNVFGTPLSIPVEYWDSVEVQNNSFPWQDVSVEDFWTNAQFIGKEIIITDSGLRVDVADQYSVRIEPGDLTNFAAHYKTETWTYNYHEVTITDPCDSETPTTVEETETTLYQDYFQVDSTVFPLRDSTASAFPKFTIADLKYYNTDNPAAITGILSEYVEVVSGTEYSIKYYYVGPKSDNTLHTTEFIPGAWRFQHIIANVSGIDDTVQFGGDIFMGRIEIELAEEKTKLI